MAFRFKLICLLAVLALPCGCICTDSKALTDALQTKAPQGQGDGGLKDSSQCQAPYIHVGADCCLDTDANAICDSDEQAETSTSTTITEETVTTEDVPTTEPAVTVSPVPTTSILQAVTSTSLQKVSCSQNIDCGQRRQERVCYQGDVYLNRISPICSKPGTQESRCISKVVRDPNPAERCSGSLSHCINGECETV